MEKIYKNWFLVLLTVINLVIVSCGKNEAIARQDFEKRILFGYECITNGTALWCDR